MLIYGVSGIFAHKKTIKQFLQPIIKQVGVDVPRGCAAFCISFHIYCIIVSGFFDLPMPFWVDFTNIYIFFAVYYVYFIKKSKSVLGTTFS